MRVTFMLLTMLNFMSLCSWHCFCYARKERGASKYIRSQTRPTRLESQHKRHGTFPSYSALITQSNPLSAIKPAFELCMDEVGKSLPINRTGNPVVHHVFTDRGLWNEEIRFEEFAPALPDDAVIIEVGGNTDAADSRILRDRYPAAFIHIYEPVPPYVAELDAKWNHDTRAAVHGVGLGQGTREVPFSASMLNGQSTYLMESTSSSLKDALAITIVDAAVELQRIIQYTPRGRIDLLHINCEGCEWELLESLGPERALSNVTHVQISFHNYSTKGLGAVVLQYCRLREMIEQTHVLVKGVPFGWERWTLRDGTDVIP